MLWGSRANPRGDRHDAQIDHGYAATIHKAQGMTVDRTHVLATPGMSSHSAYAALSRHRDRVDLHYGQDDFADQGRVVRTLSRERAKDMASDYAREPKRQFAERRGITFRERGAELAHKVPAKVQGMFDGLRLPVQRPVEPVKSTEEKARQMRRAIPANAHLCAATVLQAEVFNLSTAQSLHGSSPDDTPMTIDCELRGTARRIFMERGNSGTRDVIGARDSDRDHGFNYRRVSSRTPLGKRLGDCATACGESATAGPASWFG